MKTVSFQGVQLSAGQRRHLAFQQQTRAAFLNPVLTESIEQALAAVEARKEQGIEPERLWSVDREERGTLCIADWMGY
ncbi:MAG TPA: hypothetical protein VLG17_11370 [Pseudomonas sp.]|uniref:hypothetical protein n=1 Tax=Pseudomonas sp. TaxID=306 RepID=UPI002B69C4D6|nr:hypothetical protein [Pseudomonas sp.]HSX88585.1 hypothetical protein [Pseudomonas sp.]